MLSATTQDQLTSSQDSSSSSSSSSIDSFFRSKFSLSTVTSSFSRGGCSSSSSGSSSATTSKRRMAAIPEMFLSFSPEGCSELKMTASPLNRLASSQSVLMVLRFSKSLLRKRKSLMRSFWTALRRMQRATSFSPQATRFSFFCMTEQNSSRTLDWLMAFVFSILCATAGSSSTSFRLARYPLEHLARMIFSSHLVLALSPSFSASARTWRRSWSLRKPGLARTRHLMRSKSRLRMAAQQSVKNLPSDLRQISSPQLFLEMFLSTFFLSSVMESLTQQRCATPSSITMAAISTPWSGCASCRSRFISQGGHWSLQTVILVSSSISKVWYCPIFRQSFSLALRPLMLMQRRSSLAKQAMSSISSVSVSVLVRIFFSPETLLSSMILRRVFMRMWSPFWMRLQMCHRSSSPVGTSVTYPSPQAFFMLFRSILINQRIQSESNTHPNSLFFKCRLIIASPTLTSHYWKRGFEHLPVVLSFLALLKPLRTARLQGKGECGTAGGSFSLSILFRCWEATVHTEPFLRRLLPFPHISLSPPPLHPAQLLPTPSHPHLPAFAKAAKRQLFQTARPRRCPPPQALAVGLRGAVTGFRGCCAGGADIFRIMDSGIPVLTAGQIEELNAMVGGILEENKKKLEEQLSEQGPLEHASILQLYNLVVGEWNKKTNIIDNLCHFSLTMMSTVTLLWEQKAELEQRLQNAEHVVDNLQHHLQDLGEENDLYKLKINQAETHIESINGEKEKIEQLYRSQSCFVFQHHHQDEPLAACPSLHLLPRSNPQEQPEVEAEAEAGKEKGKLECASCRQNESQLQMEKEMAEKSSRLLSLQEEELQELRAEKQQLLSQLQELIEEHQLAKMEVELAEIAVKDALSYRESSISNRSVSARSVSASHNDQVQATRSQAQFMSGELDCFSNLDESFESRNILINEISACEDIVHFSSTPCLAQEQPEKDADETAPSPFKKKLSLVNDAPTLNDTPSFSDVCHESSIQILGQQPSKNQFSDLKIFKNRKTVSLQCDLIKNIPRLKFLEKAEKKPEPEKKKAEEARERPRTEREVERKAVVGKEKNDRTAALEKAMRLEKEKKALRKSGRQTGRMQSVVEEGPSSLGRLFSFLSSKVVTQRIRVK